MANDIELIESFYKQLGEELRNFTLPAARLIEILDFLEYERVDRDIAGIGGLVRGHILFLVIKKMYQGRGLGQSLLYRVLQRAMERNYSYIQLSVAKANLVAIHLYNKHGFKIISSMKVDGNDSYYMIKPLSFRGYPFMLKQIFSSRLLKLIPHRLIITLKFIRDTLITFSTKK